MTGWFKTRLDEIRRQEGYTKPEVAPDATRMDSNENLAIPRQFQQDVLKAARRVDVRRYPLDGSERLAAALAEYHGVPHSCVAVGNGSDHILDLLLSSFATKSTRVLTSDPTFAFFEQRCRLYSVPVLKVPFSPDMTLDADTFLAVSKDADIIYLDSPNNPTGFQFPKRDILRIIRDFAGLAVVDEAYAEFGEYSLVRSARRRRGLVVVRTLSKSHGLAGLRLGYLVANRDFVDAFGRVVQYPYPVNSVAVEAGIEALSKSDRVRGAVESIRKERRRMVEELRRHDAFDVFDSKASFVLFDAGGAYRRVYTALREQGILVRAVGSVGTHDGCLRVTVGTREMNSKFLLAIRDLLG